MGGTKSSGLNKLAMAIVAWCEMRNITLKADPLPGSLNTVADLESRRKRDWSDWRLARDVFEIIATRWRVETDLCSLDWNAQLNRFVSLKPQPGACAADALSFSWVGPWGYQFPPFGLIMECLTKIKRERSSVKLVCPLWQSAPWFPILLSLATDIPVVLRPHPRLLLSSLKEPHPLCLTYPFRLTAWRVSGEDSRIRAFRRRLLNFCWPPLDPTHTLLISRPGSIGPIGVVNTVTIP